MTGFTESPVFAEIVASLSQVKDCGRYLTARCPSHDDKHRSLSIRVGDNGALLVKCHANKGCTFDSIAKAINRKREEFFPVADTGRVKAKVKPNEVYEYVDAHGKMLFRTVRTPTKQFWVERLSGSKVVRNRDGVVNVPYRLPAIIAASDDRIIWVVEGERKVHALESLGLIATCNAGGAGKWDADWCKYFRGKAIGIIPDNDEAGWKHAHLVASTMLHMAGPIRIVELQGLGLKDDIVDWLAKYSDKDLALNVLLRTYEASPIYSADSSQTTVAMVRLALLKLIASLPI